MAAVMPLGFFGQVRQKFCPCCGGIEYAAKKALQASGKFIPWRVVIISTDGRIAD